jgi:4-alpha-glucanotransferase
VLGTWVLQMSLRPRAGELVSGLGANVIAAVNTHDTFPFAGFLRGDDIAARVETGQLDGGGARRAIAARRRLVTRLAAWRPECRSPGERDAGQRAAVSVAAAGVAGSEDGLLFRALRFLAQSRAALVLVNLEDLWGETRPQNQPGTGPERGNWQRRLAATQREIREAIRRVAEAIAAGR